jgi:hypothetical protein
MENEDRGTIGGVIWAGVGGLVAGLAAAGVCYWAAGASLGVFIGGVVFASILGPGFFLSEEGWWKRFAAAGGVVDGVAVVWLVAALRGTPTVGEWADCYVLLAAYVAALCAVAALLERAGVTRVGAAAGAVVLGIAWMTWPLWLAKDLAGPAGGRVVGWLVPLHPVLAMNGQLRSLEVWSHGGLAYRYLTNLGQDVAYAMPAGVWAAVVFYLLGAGAGFGLAEAGRRWTLRSMNQMEKAASADSSA